MADIAMTYQCKGPCNHPADKCWGAFASMAAFKGEAWAQPAESRPEVKPMREDELGRFMCVTHPDSGCLYPSSVISAEGVWVKTGQTWSSGHTRCVATTQAVDPDLYARTAPAWNCLTDPAGPHYLLPGGGCQWCGP